ncbi:uncharacterized protein K444DRAFT_626209 [Hyaloscypha bicolor E]|uniref:DUF7730 domain-containing protein n=1 Tax=Hyaloscypha bicolor E TaxID=1095630 RepID=A0A2J6TLS3_9HELO|nr:uncharacterized protein K444DRAFT_626209 [Hyaloscypha bicolor E]PMD63966.1 hypothetical protein K444DRAFT_626209 [Hyaloscypha bicolor E]
MAEQSPFMRIPSEIRLIIYTLLLNDHGHKTFEIRNEDSLKYRARGPHKRTIYRVVARDLARASKTTTYTLATKIDMHTSIMAVSQKIYQEASHILYGNRTFSFGRDIEAIVPFFSDMTKQNRALIREISLVKQGSVYCRDYDRYEWNAVCEFLKDHMRVESLGLVVEGGRPSMGWVAIPEYTVADFKTLSMVRYEALEWVWELLSIKGLRKLDVSAEIHHCPPSHSSAMSFFAAFSASIEAGFAEFLRSEMITGS